MAIRSKRVIETFLAGDLRHAESAQTRPLCLTLPPKPGVTPSDKQPVRIFLGTEAVQFRAERAFVWSVERVRDPSRSYEIHLMKDFTGFERRLWLTGFTNYRFLIPELAGARGRAIYNDTDQIYLRDPAELFDLDMGDAGVLSINDRDTSVMLIDCAKMIDLWNGRTARKVGNRELEKRMRRAGLWGDLDNGWNARDAEYAPGESYLVHYTTIHSQPWRPTPQDFVYRANPAGEIWLGIEREADTAGFQVFGPRHPTPDFAARASRRRFETPSASRLADFKRLVEDAGATSMAYYGYDRAESLSGLGAIACRTARPEDLADGAVREPVDVVAADGLAQLPDPDVAWVLDSLFAQARRAVIVAVTMDDSAHRATPADEIWWYQQLEAAGRRAPTRHWRLVVRKPRLGRAPRARCWSGGALLSTKPLVWALLHYKTGHRSQTLGLSEALGWRVEEKEIARKPLRYGLAMARDALGLGAAGWPGGLNAPWPDVVVASGWLPAVAARALQKRSHGATRLILLGRRGGRVGESQDIAVVCRHFRLPPNPRQIETILPPNKVAAGRLAAARQRWPDLFGDAAAPHIVWLVGGDNAQHALDADTAGELAARIQAQADAAGGTLAVLTSRRTREQAGRAINARLAESSRFVPWQPADQADNPYLGYLAAADILVVTGESESMIAEAVATGKPVYIAPLPAARPDLRRRVADWAADQAERDRFNARGSRRPQQGLQYACARLVDRRILLPRRDMAALHKALVAHGVARLLDGALESWRPPAWHETEWLAQRIRAMLRLPDPDGRVVAVDAEPIAAVRAG
ncbi:ELM1/GtrOC1 family putative glycosyltransferase [Salinisphaera sp.]|uniref:ELM1/GtrOC1 family putative glycosyltransferase n=1 Tax=Salinisphaera sp. TaxID=1914330 RepID=UPI002D799284|nr:ELM1/GtrOC1 family putative glycosyltransferase [Salinisphaera sp.]HET7313159.1 ELM1/GtrOC1 family putative glycosyltransferase [Salinisphaera sp.]